MTIIQKFNECRSKGSLGQELLDFVQSALREKEKKITIYEAYQLMEISNRFMNFTRLGKAFPSADKVIESLNLALLAKLFNDEDLYLQFGIDTLEMYDMHKRNFIKFDSEEAWNKSVRTHYILEDINGFLSADLEHMEILSNKRKKTRKNTQKEFPYHWSYFPYNYFNYEDELIKVLKGEKDHYEVDKTISPEICDIMTAVEVRAIELE